MNEVKRALSQHRTYKGKAVVHYVRYVYPFQIQLRWLGVVYKVIHESVYSVYFVWHVSGEGLLYLLAVSLGAYEGRKGAYSHKRIAYLVGYACRYAGDGHVFVSLEFLLL